MSNRGRPGVRRGLVRELELALERGADGVIEFAWKNSIPEPNSGCWLWLRSTKVGYAYITDPRQPIWRPAMPRIHVHRIICEVVYRPMLPEEHARHLCHNPSCVNYQHLAPGSVSENIMDSVNAGRWTFTQGEGNGRANLTAEQAQQIRSEYRRGMIGEGARLAAEFATPISTIRKVAYGFTWRHA